MLRPKFRNLESSSSSSSCSSSVHWDSVTAKKPMELICSVSLIARMRNDRDSSRTKDDDEDEDEPKLRILS